MFYKERRNLLLLVHLKEKEKMIRTNDTVSVSERFLSKELW